VRDKHWDPKLNGVDWQAVRDELRPRVEKAQTTAEVRAAMTDMLGRLGQSHFGIIAADVYRALDRDSDSANTTAKDGSKGSSLQKAEEQEQGSTGLDVRIVDDQVLVVKVQDDMPAAKVGVRPGWEILKIGDREMAPLVKRVRQAYKGSSLLDLRLVRSVLQRLGGKVGARVTVVFRDGADQEAKVDIPLAKPKGTVAQLGAFPAQYVRLEARR